MGQDGKADSVYEMRSEGKQGCGRCRGRVCCFACREREEMNGERGRLRQVVCELVEKVSGHSQREVVNCSTQTEAGVVTVGTTSQTELGVTGGKRGVCEPGESIQTKEVGCMAGGGVVKDTADWELVSGRRAYAKVVQQARVEVVNRFAVLSGGEKVREETCVIGQTCVIGDVCSPFRCCLWTR